MPKIRPKGLKYWVDYCIKLKPPVITPVYKQGLQVLKNPGVSFKQIAKTVQTDPILVFYFYKYANSAIPSQSTPIKDLEQCLCILGLDRIEKILNKIPKLTPRPHNIFHQQYLKANAMCFHGAVQAYRLSFLCSDIGSGESYLASTLMGVPYCLLWYAAVPEMRGIEWLVHKKHLPWSEAQKKVLGCTWKEITQQVAGIKDFPLLTQHALTENHRPKLRDIATSLSQIHIYNFSYVFYNLSSEKENTIRRVMSSRPLKIAMSQYLAFYSFQDWYSEKTSMAIKLLGLLTQQGYDECLAWAHKTAAETAQDFPWAGTFNSANQLITGERAAFKLSPIITIAPPLTPSPSQNSELNRGKKGGGSNKVHRPIQKQPKRPITPHQATKAKKKTIPKKKPSILQQMLNLEDLWLATRAAEEQETSVEGDGGYELPSSRDPNILVDYGDNKAPQRLDGWDGHDSSRPVIQVDDDGIRRRDIKFLTELQNRMAYNPASFKNLHELMNALMEGICHGIGLSRALGGFINLDATKVIFYYEKGISETSDLENYEAALGNGLIFDELFSHPGALWVSPSNLSQYRKLIPNDFYMSIEVDDFFLISLFVNKKPFSMIYADSYQLDVPLYDQDFKFFRSLCDAAHRGVIHFAQKSKKTTSTKKASSAIAKTIPQKR